MCMIEYVLKPSQENLNIALKFQSNFTYSHFDGVKGVDCKAKY